MGVALRIANDYREDAFTTDGVGDPEYWAQVLPMARYAGMRTSTVGESAGLAVRTLVWGAGGDTVLLWSGRGEAEGESGTAGNAIHGLGSLALADLIRWLANTRAEDRDEALRERLRAALTVIVVPTPHTKTDDIDERRLLQALLSASRPHVMLVLRDAFAPAPPLALGDPSEPAITLRVPPLAAPAVTARATEVAVALLTALRTELPDRLFRAESESPTIRVADVAAALPEASGVAIVELDVGRLPADPSRRRLRAVQVAALLSTLDGVATGAVRGADTALFARQPRHAVQAGSSPE